MPYLFDVLPGTDSVPLSRTVINVPELDSLTIDASRAAPNGYALRGFNRYSGWGLNFNEAYSYSSLFDESTAKQSAERNTNTYEMCIRHVGHPGLFVHFIGWVVPHENLGTGP